MSAAYTLDDLDIDFGDLRRLLDATYAILHEMPYERNGRRDEELDRVAALVRIAQQFSEQIERNLDDIEPRTNARWQLKEAPVRTTGGDRNG
jgi:hypothetical protein